MAYFCARKEKSSVESADSVRGRPVAAAVPTPVMPRRTRVARQERPHCLRRRRSAARALAALFGTPAAALALAPGIATAHAIVVAAQPAMNVTVPGGELAIRLDFNSRIDRKRSGLRLQRPDGSEAAIALTPDAPPGVLAGRARVAANGRWKLSWQVLSLDGHITRGEIRFSVRDATSAR